MPNIIIFLDEFLQVLILYLGFCTSQKKKSQRQKEHHKVISGLQDKSFSQVQNLNAHFIIALQQQEEHNDNNIIVVSTISLIKTQNWWRQ